MLHTDHPAAAMGRALLDRKELTAIAFERARAPMTVTDSRQPDNPIVLANRAFLELTGYSADEIIGRNARFMQGAGTSVETTQEIRHAIDDARELEIEILNYRKDGSAFWNRLSVSPIRSESGELIYFLASQLDVTELRKIQAFEATERRLLLEVDHRTNNVLAIINSIVHLSRSDSPQRYAESIQRRVQVLAQAHQLLAVARWQDVPLHKVMEQLLGHIDPSCVAFHGDAVTLSAHAVQPIALTTHELADNARRHGALSVSNGRLDVAWSEYEDGAFELYWREHGGPPPTANPTGGFGGAIISGMIERQLGGVVKRQWTPTGLLATIRVPRLATMFG